MATYLLLVIRGLEFLVIEEIESKLQVEHLEVCSLLQEQRPDLDVMRGEAGVGKIILKTTSSPQEVKSLRTVQSFLAFITRRNDIAMQNPNEPDVIAEYIINSDWNSALDLWRAHMTHPPDGNPSFRGSCVRDGRHVYKSVDIAGFIGSAVIKKYGWKVDLTNFELEIVCILFHDQMFAGIALADPTRFAFKNRLANEDRSHLSDIKYISTLRPSTAYMMFQLAQQELGDIFLDSMCGVGTIPACCSEFSQNRIFSLGGEIDEGAVKKAGVNASLKARHVGICQWDSTMLPLRPKSIDKIVIDMPFGVRCGSHRNNSKIYPKIMKEIARVLRVGGRAVLLVMSKKLLHRCIEHLPLKIAVLHDVNIGGLGVGIFVIEKTLP